MSSDTAGDGDPGAAGLVDDSPRHLGRSRTEVGPIGFGCWRFTHADPDAAREVLEAAIDLGIDLVDTADVYGLDWGGTGFGAVEELLGRVLASAPGLRERMVLATKGGIRPGVPYDSSPPVLRAACHDSLRRLGVERIDLYQIHRPDLFAHPASVVETLLDLRDEGVIGEIGISNHTPAQHDALVALLGSALATSQPELSLGHLEPLRDGTLDRCLRDDVVPLAWSPLAGGRLATGVGLPDGLTAALDELAGREGVDRAAIAIAFLLCHPARPVPIVGTQSPARLASVVRARAVHLDRHDCYRLIEAAEGVPLP